MRQSKLVSLIETLINTLIGFAVSYVGWPVAALMFDMGYTAGQHVGGCVMRWLMRLFRVHEWVYRNPYDRRCTVCGRHEVSYCWTLEEWRRSWWEAHDEGDPTKHEAAPQEDK